MADAIAVPQNALDDLAVAWSQLDRCRPRHRGEVPAAYRTVRRWARSALALDRVLVTTLSAAYLSVRAEDEGGPQLVALHWVWAVIEAGRMTSVLAASDGPERLFWELYWRPVEELPAETTDAGGRDGYVLHLASRPVRGPASATTAFLLSVARYCSP